VKVRVKGSSRLSVSAWNSGDEFVVQGSLEDDASRPAVGELLEVELGAAAESVTGCAANVTVSRDGTRFRVRTGEDGGFCMKGKGRIAADDVRVKFAGTSLLEPSDDKTKVDRSAKRPPPASLSFSSGQDAIDLDQASVTIVGELRQPKDPMFGDAVRKREGHAVRLLDERGTQLGEQTTSGDGHVRFEIKSSAFGPPGMGELKLELAPGASLTAKVAVHPVLRRAVAKLVAEKVEGVPQQGVAIPIDVTWSRGDVDGGTVEALFGGQSAGAARVEKGKCMLTATFAPPRQKTATLTLRYLPAAPYFTPGPPTDVKVVIAPTPLWPQIAVGLVVMLTAGWVVWGWRRAPRKAEEKDPTSLPPPSGRPGVQILGAVTGSGWTGVVHDAHEGTLIAGAAVRVLVGGFHGEEVVAEARTDARGEFEIVWSGGVQARIHVESTWHSAHEDALPPPSRLSIALVTRRRVLLDRLVRWAKTRGAPFDAAAEPTPGHVRRVAGRSDAADVESWARAVENAAFGSEPVNHEVEQATREKEPKGAKVVAPAGD